MLRPFPPTRQPASLVHTHYHWGEQLSKQTTAVVPAAKQPPEDTPWTASPSCQRTRPAGSERDGNTCSQHDAHKFHKLHDATSRICRRISAVQGLQAHTHFTLPTCVQLYLIARCGCRVIVLKGRTSPPPDPICESTPNHKFHIEVCS